MYPNSFYRVSIKAFIKDSVGNVLVVKENQDTWSLPGGGLDHGEKPEDGIKRELSEELGISTARINDLRCTFSFELKEKRTWLLWVVHNIDIENHDFEFGEGVTAAEFINPERLRSSDDIFEQMVHRAAGDHWILDKVDCGV